MPVVVARWANGTFSVLQAPVGFSMTSLFWKLDEEADPTGATIFVLRAVDGWSHLTFDWKHEDYQKNESGEIDFIRLKPNSGVVESHSGKLKKVKWPRGIVRMAIRTAFGVDGEMKRAVRTMTSDEIKDFPAEPVETFSVKEVRAMDPFCGVYFSYNSDGTCHYVGESRDVTSRVVESREEIGARRIGVIKCEPHDRKRIEAFYIAVLNPPGNAISTHRMRRKDSP